MVKSLVFSLNGFYQVAWRHRTVCSLFFDISNKMIFVQSGNYGCFLFCLSGRLKAGDLILDVNNVNLGGVTTDR